jgi:hypothetical protein
MEAAVKSDNIEYVPEWVYKTTWTAADLGVDEEPWQPAAELPRHRDGLLAGLGVLLIVAVLAYLLGRAS